MSANISAKMTKIGKRLYPPKDIPLKEGDYVSYELIYEDGTIGKIEAIVSKFDLQFYELRSQENE